jgi:hypothetical protein
LLGEGTEMTTWTQKYLKEAITDEVELAKLLGFGKVTRPATLTMYAMLNRAGAARTGHGTLGSDFGGVAPLPQWRRNWASAGPLIGRLSLKISHDLDEGTVTVGASDRRRSVTEAYKDHPSVDAAIWAAISRAAIQLLIDARDSA